MERFRNIAKNTILSICNINRIPNSSTNYVVDSNSMDPTLKTTKGYLLIPVYFGQLHLKVNSNFNIKTILNPKKRRCSGF